MPLDIGTPKTTQYTHARRRQWRKTAEAGELAEWRAPVRRRRLARRIADGYVLTASQLDDLKQTEDQGHM